MSYKQVILVREDLRLPRGKLAAQVAHASLEAVLKADKKIVQKWRDEGAKKVVLKVNDENELLKYKDMLERTKIKTALITDAGHTVLTPGTITCLGIAPEEEGIIDKITGKLRMV